MRLLLLMMIGIFTCTTLFAQEWDIKEDKFDGTKTMKSKKAVMLGSSLVARSYVIIVKKDTTRYLMFSFPAIQVTSYSDKDNAILLFSDDTKKEISWVGEYQVVSKYDVVNFMMEVSKEDLQDISTKTITDIRFEDRKGKQDYPVKDKYRSDFTELIKVIATL